MPSGSLTIKPMVALPFNRSLDGSRVVAGGTASRTQLELGLPGVNFSFNLYCYVGSDVG